MSFNGYRCIQEKNIKHIYSGPPIRILPKAEPKSQFVHRRPRRDQPNYTKYRNLQYFKEFESFLPRAPAFNSCKRNEVDLIVNRLSAGKNDSEYFDNNKAIQNIPKNSVYSTANIRASSARLARQQTISSKVRSVMRDKQGPEFVLEVQQSCPRSTKPPSMRYFPNAYKNWLKFTNI